MEIVTNIKKSDFETKGNLVSEIYLKFGETTFPDSGWTDFIIIIFDWWINEFLSQLSGEENGKYEFMDGPFFFEISIDKGDIILTGFERRVTSKKKIIQFNIEIKEFLSTLKIACNEILRFCHKMKYSSPDVKKLEKSFKQIQGMD